MRIKNAFVTILVGVFVLSLPCAALEKEKAIDITRGSTMTLYGAVGDAAFLRDKDESTKVRFKNGGTVMLKNPHKTATLYLVWDIAPKEWRLHISNWQFGMGKSRYLHQYVKIPAKPTTIRISFDGAAVLCEIRQLTNGTPPPDIQEWQPPLKDADMLLLPTHADDEHLYFGGTIPTYTAQGKAVQVAYMTDHKKEPHRRHELLNGLWAAGIRNYPVVSTFPDLYSPSLAHAKTVYDESAWLAYQVELIRRFSPKVIVGHDANGEYGHGAHMLNAATLQKAVIAAADKQQYPKSLQKYGAWDTPKTYLHLWPKNGVVMDWDKPLAAFDGASAYETAVTAFAHHISQQDYFKVEQTGPYDCR
ncbi:MAG: PIG-L family deacetylase, partial [Ruthenibacterium sp.]